ncbi:type VI secretion system-associated protein TagF [Roseococcus pinisoli]|uniref:Type VI secretion system-associated protein TagF n=1 Tax=Roseococcus pinisoli TaxID=2835040 RepID=A0ABS5QI57_9PROT|nr:type VI secretion system-associated protein TagF [Roseococcus pinisoli]MBS7813321.1 type VI secretion system-associated protein TagF [Roseococcus pinisoli]
MEERHTGLFGKLPAHGDFVRRALPRSFVAPWDAWVSEGIAAARERLGDEWETAWAEAPVWRFRLAPGACGPDAAYGVLVTSADTVGRCFPLTLAAVLPIVGQAPPEAWYDALEAAALDGRAGSLDADQLAASLPEPPPDEDPDGTLDGRSLFWSATQPSRAMPSPADFLLLLERHEAEQPRI